MNLDVRPSAGVHLVVASFLAPAAIFRATLAQGVGRRPIRKIGLPLSARSTITPAPTLAASHSYGASGSNRV
jgi:hypothetical protein